MPTNNQPASWTGTRREWLDHMNERDRLRREFGSFKAYKEWQAAENAEQTAWEEANPTDPYVERHPTGEGRVCACKGVSHYLGTKLCCGILTSLDYLSHPDMNRAWNRQEREEQYVKARNAS